MQGFQTLHWIGKIIKIKGSHSMCDTMSGTREPVNKKMPPQNSEQTNAARMSTGLPVGKCTAV